MPPAVAHSAMPKSPNKKTRPEGRVNFFRSFFASAERFDPGRKPRHLSRRGVLVKDTLGHAAHKFGLSLAERSCGHILVARCDRFFDRAKISADPRAAGFVDGKAAFALAGAFFGLRRICHGVFPLLGRLRFRSRERPTPGFMTGRFWPKRAARACLARRIGEIRWKGKSKVGRAATYRETAVRAFRQRRPCLRPDPRSRRANGRDGVRTTDLRAAWFRKTD